jgi:hypothetical protein
VVGLGRVEFERAADISAAHYYGDVDEGEPYFETLCREGGSTFRDGHKGW